MKLQPFDVSPTSILPGGTEISEALSIVGMAKKETSAANVRAIFDAAGASVEDIAHQVGYILRTASKEETRLKAGEFAAKVHGMLLELEKSDKNIPQINITINGSGGQSLINLVMPKEQS